MADLTVQVVDRKSGLPVRRLDVVLRIYAGMGEWIDYDNVTDEDGMADFLMIPLERADFLVAGDKKSEIYVQADFKTKLFGGEPVVVEI